MLLLHYNNIAALVDVIIIVYNVYNSIFVPRTYNIYVLKFPTKHKIIKVWICSIHAYINL